MHKLMSILHSKKPMVTIGTKPIEEPSETNERSESGTPKEDKMKKTDIQELEHKEKRFSWGEIIARHSVREYDILEYHPWVYVNNCGTSEIDTSKTEFDCYINGDHIGISAESLDSALATCIAYKHDGSNSQAAIYFMRMIKKVEGS